MGTRSKRLKLLTDHRQRQLDDRIAEFHACTRAEADARARERDVLSACVDAELKRKSAAEQGVESGAWVELNHWLQASQQRYRMACAATLAAEQKSAAAQQKVLAARGQLKQVETLAERLRAREALQERRGEQRAADEHTQLMAARRGQTL
jgi:flagellar export protein FliJ